VCLDTIVGLAVVELAGTGEAGFTIPHGLVAALTVAGADITDTREQTRIAATSKRHVMLVIFFINYTPFSNLYIAAFVMIITKMDFKTKVYFAG